MKKIGCLVMMVLVTHGTVLSMMHSRKILSKTSHLKLHRSYSKPKFQEPLMDENDRYRIREAYISALYKVAQIEAMCKIYSTPNLDANQRGILLDQVPYIVRE